MFLIFFNIVGHKILEISWFDFFIVQFLKLDIDPFISNTKLVKLSSHLNVFKFVVRVNLEIICLESFIYHQNISK